MHLNNRLIRLKRIKNSLLTRSKEEGHVQRTMSISRFKPITYARMLNRVSILIKPRRVIAVVPPKCLTRREKIYHLLQAHVDQAILERDRAQMSPRWQSKLGKISNNHLKGVSLLMLTHKPCKIVKPKLISNLTKAVSK